MSAEHVRSQEGNVYYPAFGQATSSTTQDQPRGMPALWRTLQAKGAMQADLDEESCVKRVKDLVEGIARYIEEIDEQRPAPIGVYRHHLCALDLPLPTKLERMIEQIAAQRRIGYGSVLAARLQALTEAAEEEGEQMQAESLATFLDFLVDNRIRSAPETTMTPEGHLFASWSFRGGGYVAAEFLKDETIRYVFYIPREVEKTARSAGEDTVAEFTRLLRFHVRKTSLPI